MFDLDQTVLTLSQTKLNMLEESEREELKEKLEEEFSDYYEIAGGKNYRQKHLETVRKIAIKIAEKVEANPDGKVLEIAALYHDIGRADDIEDGEMDPFEGHEGHEKRGAEKVSEFVDNYVSKHRLDRIENVIRNHHSEPETVEGKIVQDADELSVFGVNNLWRQIHYASYHELTFEESMDYFWNTAVDEYREKIKSFHFQVSKEIAQRRLEKHKKAVRDIEDEMEAADI